MRWTGLSLTTVGARGPVETVDNLALRGYTDAVEVRCLLAAVVVAAAMADDGAPPQAQLYFAKGRLLAVYPTHIELYRYGNVTPAVVRPEHDPRPLLPGLSVKGFPAFLDKRGRTVELRPERRSFGELWTPPEKAAASPVVSICAKAPGGFCGVIGLDGEERAALRSEERPGEARMPVGAKGDGTEALFALTLPRSDGTPEIVGYRLWRRRKGERAPREERLTPDDPQVRVMLESYEGELLLPRPGGTLFFREERPRRRR